MEIPAIFLGIDVFAGFKDAGVSDNDVESTVGGDGFVNGSLKSGIIGDVADGSGKPFASKIGDNVGIDVETDDGGAVVAKTFSSGASDSSAGSGDDGDFSGVNLFRHGIKTV